MKDEDIESIEAQLKQIREKHTQALHEKDTRIKRTEEQLKRLQDKDAKHAQVLQEKDTRIKRTEQQLKQLREKHAQVLREKDTRIKRTEEQLKQCKTWLQDTFEKAPPCMKT